MELVFRISRYVMVLKIMRRGKLFHMNYLFSFFIGRKPKDLENYDILKILEVMRMGKKKKFLFHFFRKTRFNI